MVSWSAGEARAAARLMRRLVAVGLLACTLLLVLLLMITNNAGNRAHYSALLSPAPAAEDGRSPLDADDDGCAPRQAIFFLKTHKCASSTVQNILMRYGERHTLDFVLSDAGNYIGSPGPFNSRWIPSSLWPRSGRFHVFTHHTRLHVAETRRVMQDGAAWVTVLRHPVAQFESAYDYYGFSQPGNWNLTLKQFIELPLERKRALKRISYGRFGGNQMAFDLGYEPDIVHEPRLVATMLADLEQAFDLVMIAEMLDESLVLLRQLMCWSTDDVTYFTKNARFDSFRTELSGADRDALEQYLQLDMALYNHFRRRLTAQIAAQPIDTFLARTEALVARRLYWKQRCVVSEVKGSELSGQQREITGHVKGYRLSDSSDWMCSRLGMAELGYTDLLRDGQRQRLAVWHRVYSLLGLDDRVQRPEGNT